MRILFAVHGYKPAYRIGGPVLSVSALAERLVRRGHEVTVVPTNSYLDRDLEDVPLDAPVDVDGVEVWYFRRRDPIRALLPRVRYLSQSLGFLYAPRMREALNERVPRVDVVHTHLPFVYPTLAAAHAAFTWGKPLVYHQRGVFDPARLQFRSAKKRAWLELVEKPILRRATRLIALSAAEASSYRRLGITTPVRIVPNGIAAEEYRCRSEGREAALGIPAGARVVLFLGRLHPTKGADRLLEAFLRIAAGVPDVVLVLAGPDECLLEERYRSAVRAQALEARVVFPGMVEGELKKDLLARASLFVLPSDAEGMSMAVLEALASGTAILLSPGCHFPEAEEAGAGRVVAADAEPLAGAMGEMLSAPDGLEAAGIRGRELVEARFGWESVADRMVEVYDEALRERGMSR